MPYDPLPLKVAKLEQRMDNFETTFKQYADERKDQNTQIILRQDAMHEENKKKQAEIEKGLDSVKGTIKFVGGAFAVLFFLFKTPDMISALAKLFK